MYITVLAFSMKLSCKVKFIMTHANVFDEAMSFFFICQAGQVKYTSLIYKNLYTECTVSSFSYIVFEGQKECLKDGK